MRHKHADLIHAWAEGVEIEVLGSGGWITAECPGWIEDCEYRIKPEKKPDIVRYLGIKPENIYLADTREIIDRWPNQLMIVFDGETEKVKSVGILMDEEKPST